MLNAEVLTFQEFVTHEPLPLSKIQGAVLEFLQGRDDAVLFGAQAVNAYVSEPRATKSERKEIGISSMCGFWMVFPKAVRSKELLF